MIDFLKIWINLWPIGLIVAGGLVWLANRNNWVWATILALAGAIALINSYTDLNLNIWTLIWPAIMIAIGISIIVRGGKSSRSKGNEISIDETDQFALLSGAEHRVTSKNYLGGKATAVMGGVELDLRDVVIKKQAVIDVFVLMGGVEIKAPAGVRVKSDAGAILGGIEIKSDTKATNESPVLIITGTVVMGGVEVKY